MQFSRLQRREFISLLGGATAWPLVARAQQSELPIVGFLGSDTPDLFADRLLSFREGLKTTGYFESRNVAIEYRWAKGRNDALPALAADLVRMRAAVLVASTTPSAFALKAATRSIPIVFFIAGDPVALGLVSSLNHPGGTLTGTTALPLEVGTKWLQLLQEAVPTPTTFAMLIIPTSPNLAEAQAKDLRVAANTLGLQIHVLEASTVDEFESAFANAIRLGAGGLVIASDSLFFAYVEQLAGLANHHKLPAIFGFREYARAGGLMSYGADLNDQHRTMGNYVGRILK